jgi:parvulin-like peptidyl-prolyl isomerase
MKPRLGISTRTGLKIAAAVALSLLGMALLPLMALPYGSLDWLAYDPAYKQGYSFPPTAQPPPKAAPEIPCAERPGSDEPLAARVNGQGIGLRAFEREMAQFLAALEASGADLQGENVQAEMPQFRRQVLDRLIDDVLVQQAAVELQLTISGEEIQIRVSEEISQSGGLDWFEGWLQETGQTRIEYERDVCQDLLRQAILDRVTAGITGTMEMVWARQIVVASVEDAWAALTRLASGEGMAEVAKEISLDEWTRDLGGDLGWLPRGLGWIAPEVEDAAFSGKPGQVQGPFQVGDRYVIIQTLDHQANHPLDPDTREALRAIAFEQWLAERRGAAEIEIMIDLDSPVP